MLLVYPCSTMPFSSLLRHKHLATWEFGRTGLQFRDDSYMYVGAEIRFAFRDTGYAYQDEDPRQTKSVGGYWVESPTLEMLMRTLDTLECLHIIMVNIM
jgi:hypothetical protein